MKFAIPFQDDSSLFFAAKVAKELQAMGHISLLVKILERGNKVSKLSDRQLQATLGASGPDLDMAETSFMKPEMLRNFDAVITCRLTGMQREMMGQRKYRRSVGRPAFVSFMAGLDFTPERGMANRRHFDITFLNTPEDCAAFRSSYPDRLADWGHPYFITPPPMRMPAEDAPVYFFTQSISPVTLGGRLHVLQLLVAIALLHPQRRVALKLRHLPGENEKHAHKEDFSYPWLYERMFRYQPPNVEFITGSMADALDDAGIAITCTSTAAIDTISNGTPTMLYLDYVENYADYTVEPMRRIFEGSGVVRSLPDLLDLDVRPPNPEWLAKRFRGPEIYKELISAIEQWKIGQRKSNYMHSRV